MCIIRITGEREREPGGPMTTEITFLLNIAPDADWRDAFLRSNSHVVVEWETIEYLVVPMPTVTDNRIVWPVPTFSKDAARAYLQQYIDYANAMAPMRVVMAIEEPSAVGGQWHAMEAKPDESWPATTMCGDVEPREGWNTVTCWIEAGVRRCNRCSLVAGQAGHPSQLEVRIARRDWERGL